MDYAIVDIETTGSFSGNDRITEIAIIIHNGKKVIDRYESLVNPETMIPAWITSLTGITNEMVQEKIKELKPIHPELCSGSRDNT